MGGSSCYIKITFLTFKNIQGRRDGRATVYTLTDTHVAHIFLDAYRHTSEHADD